jgi:hypothetical protein
VSFASCFEQVKSGDLEEMLYKLLFDVNWTLMGRRKGVALRPEA